MKEPMKEDTFGRLVVTRWVWVSDSACWYREYVGRSMPGQLIATSRAGATTWPPMEGHKANREREIAQKALYRLNATPWKITRVKVVARSKMRTKPPKVGEFATLPGLLSFNEYASSEGVEGIPEDDGFRLKVDPRRVELLPTAGDEIVVQVNGKLRGSVRMVVGGYTEETVQTAARTFLTPEDVVKKVMYVPGKILNLVV